MYIFYICFQSTAHIDEINFILNIILFLICLNINLKAFESFGINVLDGLLAWGLVKTLKKGSTVVFKQSPVMIKNPIKHQVCRLHFAS